MANFEALFKPTIDRLAHLLLRQYGCHMEYLHLTELQRSVLPTLRHKLAAGNTVNSGENIFIPVFLNRRLAGAAQIMHAYNLGDSELRLMQQIVQTVIESTLMNLDRMELIEELESQLKQAEQNQNILPMSHYRPNPFPLENRSRMNNDHFDFACLIESKNPEDVFKMALEIHHHSGRYAFLRAHDLSDDVWTNAFELNRLGAVSIFIDDICELSMERQKYLCDFLRSRLRKTAPQIIVGTTRTYRELVTAPSIHPGLLEEITVGYLHMSQPFSKYQKENLLDFFFEGLAGRARMSMDGRPLDGFFSTLSPDGDHLPPH